MPADNKAQPVNAFREKGNRRKTAAAIAAVLVAAVLLTGSFVLYSYLTPVIALAISKPVDPNAESYAQMVTVGYSTKLDLPMPPHIREHLAEFGTANNDALLELHENYTTPMQIEATVKVVDKQTIVTYSGTATDKNGERVPYEKELVFDFVLTKETP